MARNRTIPSRQPTGMNTLAAPIGILPRREGRQGMSTPFSYGIAATVSARVRDTREGQAPRPPPCGKSAEIASAKSNAFPHVTARIRTEPTIELTPPSRKDFQWLPTQHH